MPERVRLSAISRIRRMVINTPNITFERVKEKLGENKPSDLVIGMVMQDTHETVRELVRMGKLKG